MPATQNLIDILEFPIMRGEVPTWRAHIEPITRPNVDGDTYRLLGYRSAAFNVVTLADEATVAQARQAAVVYAQLVAAGAVQFVKNNINYLTDEGLMVKVLAVQPQVITGCSNVVGGNQTNSTAIITAQWTLKFVDATA